MGEGVHIIKGKYRADRDTDKGLNKQEAYTVKKLENQIRNLDYEKAYYIDNEGKVMGESYTHRKSSAEFRDADNRKAYNKNAILIHNHPRDFNDMAGRIGNPFSGADVMTAAQLNMKEVRAVTPTYTYSIRRPEGGWPSLSVLKRALKANSRSWRSNARDYMTTHRRRGILSADERQGRANVVMQNVGMRELAKRFGWEFTRQKTK